MQLQMASESVGVPDNFPACDWPVSLHTDEL